MIFTINIIMVMIVMIELCAPRRIFKHSDDVPEGIINPFRLRETKIYASLGSTLQYTRPSREAHEIAVTTHRSPPDATSVVFRTELYDNFFRRYCH